MSPAGVVGYNLRSVASIFRVHIVLCMVRMADRHFYLSAPRQQPSVLRLAGWLAGYPPLPVRADLRAVGSSMHWR